MTWPRSRVRAGVPRRKRREGPGVYLPLFHSFGQEPHARWLVLVLDADPSEQESEGQALEMSSSWLEQCTVEVVK